MVFDINMEDFRRKGLLVVGGHVTYATHLITYTSVVSSDNFCIYLMINPLDEF